MKRLFGKLSVFGLLVSTVTLSISGTALAHVTVKPAEVVTAGFQTFAVSVPNEKNIPVTKVKLSIPANVTYVMPTVKAGWEITTEKDGSGENATVKSITWANGSIPEGMRDEFSFSAKVPDTPTDLQWKAYQTYSDGTVVSWDKESHGEHETEDANSGPFSVTKVVSTTATETAAKNAEKAASDAKDTAQWALYAAGAAIILGLIGVFLATRKR